MSGCNLPSCGRPLSCTSRVFLHIVGFLTLQVFPQLREETLSFHSGEAVMGLYASVSLSVLFPSSGWEITSELSLLFSPNHAQVPNGVCKVMQEQEVNC